MAVPNLDKLTEPELSVFINSLYDEATDSIKCDAVRALDPEYMAGDPYDFLIRGYGTTLVRYAVLRLQIMKYRCDGELDRARRTERLMDAAYEALPPWLKW